MQIQAKMRLERSTIIPTKQSVIAEEFVTHNELAVAIVKRVLIIILTKSVAISFQQQELELKVMQQFKHMKEVYSSLC